MDFVRTLKKRRPRHPVQQTGSAAPPPGSRRHVKTAQTKSFWT